MSKSEMSAGFKKFAAKTTRGSYDEARKNERMGGGIPFEVGTKGRGVVSAVICDETKEDAKGEKHPRIRVEISVTEPEAARGKTLSGPGLMQTIKDGRDPAKWSAEQAFGAALGMLENLGCPEEITKGYERFEEVLEFFDDEPREVSWSIEENRYTNAKGQEIVGKQVNAFAYIPSPETSAEPESEELDPNAKYVMYRGAKHKVEAETEEDYDLVSVNGGRKRTGVAKQDCEPC